MASAAGRHSPAYDRPNMSDLRIVLLGKNESENIRVGNTIWGTTAFNREDSSYSQQHSVRISGEVEDRHITVINTHLLQPNLSHKQIIQRVKECVSLSAPGPHVIALVLQYKDFRKEDRKRVKYVLSLFSEQAMKHTIVLTTDEEPYIFTIRNNAIHDLIKECGGGYLEFDTINSELIRKTEDILKKENEEFLICDMYEDEGGTSEDEDQSRSGASVRGDDKEKKDPDLKESTKTASHGGDSREREDELRIVLLGKTGVGKSSSGNTILGREAFISDISQTSVTKVCQKETAEINSRHITVIDTPGLFDTDLTNEEIQREITECISMILPGPHVFLLVIPVGRFTEEEQTSVKIIQETFGEKSLMFTIVLFTRGDFLENKTIKKYLGKPESALNQLIEACGNRFHVFNNKETGDQTQVTDLLQKIDNMVKANGGSYYSCKIFRDMEREKQEKEKKTLTEKVEQVKKEKEELMNKHKEEKKKMKMMMKEDHDKERKRREEAYKRDIKEREEQERKMREEMKREREEWEKQKQQERQRRDEEDERRRKIEKETWEEYYKTLKRERERRYREKEDLQSKHEEERERMKMMMEEERQKRDKERKRREDEYREEQYKRDIKDTEEQERKIREQLKREREEWEKQKQQERQREEEEEKETHRFIDLYTGTPEAQHTKNDEDSPSDSRCLRILLFGRKGSRKSATGNTILGKKEFHNEASSQLVTTVCQKEVGEVDGRSVAVINTPGLFDPSLTNEQVQEQIMNCVSLSAPGPHVFIIVLSVGKITQEEKDTLDMIKMIFGQKAADFCIVLFTRGDKLKKHTIEEHVQKNAELKKLTRDCGNRFLAFNNTETEDRKQVTQLFNLIEDMNQGRYFTNEMFEEAAISTEQRMEMIEENERQNLTQIKELQTKYDIKIKSMRKRLEDKKQKTDEERERLKNKFREQEETLRREFEEKENLEQKKRETEDQKRSEEEKQKIAEYDQRIEKMKREMEDQRIQYEKQQKQREEEDRKREEEYKQDQEKMKNDHENIMAELRKEQEEEIKKRDLEEQNRKKQEEKEREEWKRKIKEAESDKETQEEIKRQQREWEEEKKRKMREGEEEEKEIKVKHKKQLREKQEELEKMKTKFEREREEDRMIEKEKQQKKREREQKVREYEEKRNEIKRHYEQLERERKEEWKKRKQEDEERRVEKRKRWEKMMEDLKRDQEEEIWRRERVERERIDRDEKECEEMKQKHEEEIEKMKKKHQDEARKQREELKDFTKRKERQVWELKERLKKKRELRDIQSCHVM